MQRIFNCNKIQDNNLTPDKGLNSLIYSPRSSFCVVTHKSRTFKNYPFLRPTQNIRAYKDLNAYLGYIHLFNTYGPTVVCCTNLFNDYRSSVERRHSIAQRWADCGGSATARRTDRRPRSQSRSAYSWRACALQSVCSLALFHSQTVSSASPPSRNLHADRPFVTNPSVTHLNCYWSLTGRRRRRTGYDRTDGRSALISATVRASTCG